jgi:hypothetical protein
MLSNAVARVARLADVGVARREYESAFKIDSVPRD